MTCQNCEYYEKEIWADKGYCNGFLEDRKIVVYPQMTCVKFKERTVDGKQKE